MGDTLWFLVTIIAVFGAVYFIDCTSEFFAKGRELLLYVDGKEIKYKYIAYNNGKLYVRNMTGDLVVLQDWVILDKESLFHFMFKRCKL